MFSIPCTLFRGGTSKGPFFLRDDLPSDPASRDALLLSLMGSPHARQIDGIGGGDSLSSKVSIVSPSRRPDADIDFLLCQVHVNEAIVETSLNCGNMLSAVGPFAIEQGLVETTDPETVIRIHNQNTGVVMIATMQTPKGKITYTGDTAIDGVPGTAAPIKLSFIEPVGVKTGKLLPTGNVTDEFNIDGVIIPVSCVDVAVPMIITYAEAMGKTGLESKIELDSDRAFMTKLEKLRQTAAFKMGLGDVTTSISPKICMVSRPQKGGMIRSQYFTPFDCHDAHAVSGALCLAAACLIVGSVANNMALLTLPADQIRFEKEINIEHPSGKICIAIKVDRSGPVINFPFASFERTARPLMVGNVYVPSLPVETPETNSGLAPTL